MYLLNGESKHNLDFSDRGLQYGDGLFETIEVIKGKPVFFLQHLKRLQLGCDKLLIPTPDQHILKSEIQQLSEASEHAVIKVIITRGSGGRGYKQPERVFPTRLISLHPFPEYPDSFYFEGITARFCHHRLSLNPYLAGIKHLNRLDQVLARAEWGASDIQEGLMLDHSDYIVEGTMTNLFIVKDGILFTPVIENSGVDGVIRNIVMNLSRKHNISTVESFLTKEQLIAADEVFVTNSIIGIWPVQKLEKQCYKIGSITKKMMALFAKYKQEDLELAN